MSGEEAGGAVECGVRLVEAAVVVLEDVGESGPVFHRDLDVVGARTAGRPDRVVEQHLVRSDLDEQGGAVR
ncbi:hypothetical protein ACFC00_03875 [Streptomyces adustus]|uniref:hypothetical protein n=1 Tax=Streptomyces adustus TaxID=1609272 RepID=UPI0035DD1F45